MNRSCFFRFVCLMRSLFTKAVLLTFILVGFCLKEETCARRSVANPGCLSRIRIFPSRIGSRAKKDSGSASKNISILTLKLCLSSRKYDLGCSSRIRILIPIGLAPGIRSQPCLNQNNLNFSWFKIGKFLILWPCIPVNNRSQNLVICEIFSFRGECPLLWRWWTAARQQEGRVRRRPASARYAWTSRRTWTAASADVGPPTAASGWFLQPGIRI